MTTGDWTPAGAGLIPTSAAGAFCFNATHSIETPRPMPVLAMLVSALLALPAQAEVARTPETLTPAQLAACKARGGHPEMVLYYVEACVWPASDAGTACRDKADCEGFCEAPFGTGYNARVVGQCSRNASDRAGGCSNHVERGRSTGDMCVH